MTVHRCSRWAGTMKLAKDSFKYLLVGSQTLSTRFAISLAESSDVAVNTTVLALNLRAIRSNMAWLTTSAADSGGTVLGIVVSRSVSEVSRWMIESDSGRYLLLAVATSDIGNVFALVNERLDKTKATDLAVVDNLGLRVPSYDTSCIRCR